MKNKDFSIKNSSKWVKNLLYYNIYNSYYEYNFEILYILSRM